MGTVPGVRGPGCLRGCHRRPGRARRLPRL